MTNENVGNPSVSVNVKLELREYQARACDAVEAQWAEAPRVVLVCPTGGGKTAMGEELVARQGKPTVWLAHRRELVRQAAERLRSRFGDLDVGIVMPGHPPSPYARVQVSAIQTLIAREQRPEAGLVVFDECHHALAKSYRAVVDAYPGALHLGLTATPERQDGTPLGDCFDRLVVAAQYSELLRDGYLVPMRVYQPPDIPGNGYALDPLQAWERYAANTQTFAFFTQVEEADGWREKFDAAGIPSALVHAKTTNFERQSALDDFRRGKVKVLFNVFVFTEGTDVPAAETILLARQCGHVSTYLQMAGRALRPSPGKVTAKLIDLTGASLIHGLPLEDRIYSLEGNGIKRTSETPLKQCLQCGATILSAYRVCPECKYVFPHDPKRDPTIYDWALTEVFAGEQTPTEAKDREYSRLRRLAKVKGYGVAWVGREWKKLFGKMPDFVDVSEDEKRAEFRRLQLIGVQKGFKPGFAGVVYKQTFGAWPPRAWNA